MDYLYKINKINGTILVTVAGDLNTDNFDKLCLDIYKLALEMKSKVIFDFTDVNITLSIGEAYYWFSDHLDKVDLRFRKIPIAYIASDKNWDFIEFIETTWSNRGIVIKIFKDQELAVKWLTCIRYKLRDAQIPPNFRDITVGH